LLFAISLIFKSFLSGIKRFSSHSGHLVYL
jgi:hypothetical protein